MTQAQLEALTPPELLAVIDREANTARKARPATGPEFHNQTISKQTAEAAGFHTETLFVMDYAPEGIAAVAMAVIQGMKRVTPEHGLSGSDSCADFVASAILYLRDAVERPALAEGVRRLVAGHPAADPNAPAAPLYATTGAHARFVADTLNGPEVPAELVNHAMPGLLEAMPAVMMLIELATRTGKTVGLPCFSEPGSNDFRGAVVMFPATARDAFFKLAAELSQDQRTRVANLGSSRSRAERGPTQKGPGTEV